MSCDTFVALNAATTKGCIIFGKNSDRPKGEVQEVLYFPAADHAAGSKVQVSGKNRLLHNPSLVAAEDCQWDIRPGAHPTNGISIEFEIPSKFGVL